MAQMVVRIDDELTAEIDLMVDAGAVANRSEALRLGVSKLVDAFRREQVGLAIVAGYEDRPQSDDEVDLAAAGAARMIADEPW